VVVAVAAIGCSSSGPSKTSPSTSPSTSAPAAVLVPEIHKIKHVVMIMQENRSFDSYFGTYPGADGIPMVQGKPSMCVPDPKGGCVRPYPDHADVNGGGPHGASQADADLDFGKMDGFVRVSEGAQHDCAQQTDPACAANAGRGVGVMGYHTQSDIPNYWVYAHDFVLQDHMFEPNASWSLPEHLFQVSEWAARRVRTTFRVVA
jgi:phospholipase C